MQRTKGSPHTSRGHLQEVQERQAKSGGDRLGEVVVLRAVLIVVKGLSPGVIS